MRPAATSSYAAHHGGVRETLGEQHRVGLTRVGVRLAQRGELLEAGAARLVGEHAHTRAHGDLADRRPVGGNRGGDDDVDTVECGIEIGDDARVFVLRREPWPDAIFRRRDGGELRARFEQTRDELDHVQVVGADDGELRHVRRGGACSARARCRAGSSASSSSSNDFNSVA